MSFLQLPLDAQIEFLLNLSPEETSRYCRSSLEVNRICRSNEFLNQLIVRKYGLNPNEVPGASLSEKYQFIALFDWTKIPGATRPEQLRYILRIIREAAESDISLRQTPGYTNRYGDGDTFQGGILYSEALTDIVLRAIRTGDPQLVYLVLTELVRRIPPQDLPLYNHAFLHAFAEALRLEDPRIIQMIHPYYDPSLANGLASILYSAISKGDLTMVQALLPFSTIDAWTIEYALTHNQPEIAHLLRSFLYENRNRSTGS